MTSAYEPTHREEGDAQRRQPRPNEFQRLAHARRAIDRVPSRRPRAAPRAPRAAPGTRSPRPARNPARAASSSRRALAAPTGARERRRTARGCRSACRGRPTIGSGSKTKPRAARSAIASIEERSRQAVERDQTRRATPAPRRVAPRSARCLASAPIEHGDDRLDEGHEGGVERVLVRASNDVGPGPGSERPGPTRMNFRPSCAGRIERAIADAVQRRGEQDDRDQ